jgi:hypothetical protein
VFDQAANGVGSVGASLRVLIVETVEEELEEGTGVGGDGSAHAVNALSENTNGGGTLKSLATAGIAEDGLLEDLPELSEAGAESGGHAGDNVKSGVDDDPIELGSLFTGLGSLLLGTELKLARVLLGDDVGDHLDHVVQHSLVSDESRTTEAEVLSHVSVNVGDGGT